MRRLLHVALFLGVSLGSATPAAQTAAGPRPCPGASGKGVAIDKLGLDQPHLLLDRDFPDPFIARFNGAYHAYATGVGQMNVQRVKSSDLRDWSAPAEALASDNLPEWVDRGHAQVWAPEVMAVGGRYVLYFNARHRALTRIEHDDNEGGAGERLMRRHCIGAAVASTPEGPFQGTGQPLVCAGFADGVIDASPFRDGDSLYLYYKEDSNCCGRRSAIYVQELSRDGLAATGTPHKLLGNMESAEKHDDWEWRVVEAPTMLKRAGAYYLFYSGNHFGNKNYAVGYRICASPRGPCRDLGDNPILWSHPKSPLLGPGHQAILDEGARTRIFFHGWNEEPSAGPSTYRRCLYTSRIRWDRWRRAAHEVPTVVGGSPTPRPE